MNMRKVCAVIDNIQYNVNVRKITLTQGEDRQVTFVIRSKSLRDSALKVARSLEEEGKEFAKALMEVRGEPTMEIVIRPHKKKFSREQQNRCMEIIRQISEKKHVEGKYYSVDSWLEYFRQMFIGVEEMPSGKTKGLPTSKLSTSEYNDFMTQIEAWASENDVSIVLNT